MHPLCRLTAPSTQLRAYLLYAPLPPGNLPRLRHFQPNHLQSSNGQTPRQPPWTAATCTGPALCLPPSVAMLLQRLDPTVSRHCHRLAATLLHRSATTVVGFGESYNGSEYYGVITLPKSTTPTLGAARRKHSQGGGPAGEATWKLLFQLLLRLPASLCTTAPWSMQMAERSAGGGRMGPG